MNLRDVSTFGTAEADNDDLLLECFQDHDAYQAAKAHRKFLIVGRKGSGKTAIFRKLVAETSWNQFCHGHSFSDYPWFHHDKQRKSGVPDAECFRYSWEYVILISLAKIILQDANQPFSDASLNSMVRLEDFVVDTYGTKTPDLKYIFSPNTELRFKPSMKVSFGALSAGVSAEKVLIESLPLVIYEVNQSISEAVIECLNPDFQYHVCFDELDRGFSATDPIYKLRLSGLLIAARDFNRRLSQAGKRASVVIFLRDDILRYLRFEDKNKIVEDSSAVIEWDKSIASSRTLKSVMERRFSKLLEIPTNNAWDSVFAEERLMAGKQLKYQHILDRTFKRPRDVIKFSNEILRVYKQSGSADPRFANEDIINARDEYSKYLRKELVDEMNQYYPEEEFGFTVLRNIGNLGFSLSKFKETYETLSSQKTIETSYADALRHLYNFSVIGYLKVGGAGGGSEYVWRYEDTEAEYDERAITFRVHNGLKEVLGLLQGFAGAGVEPATDQGEGQ